MNILDLKTKRIEKQYKDFYKNGQLDLTLDEVNKNEIHNTTTLTEQTYAESYLRLLNNKIS